MAGIAVRSAGRRCDDPERDTAASSGKSFKPVVLPLNSGDGVGGGHEHVLDNN